MYVPVLLYLNFFSIWLGGDVTRLLTGCMGVNDPIRSQRLQVIVWLVSPVSVYLYLQSKNISSRNTDQKRLRKKE